MKRIWTCDVGLWKVPFRGSLSSSRRPKWINLIADGDDGLGSHSALGQYERSHGGDEANRERHTFSPIPPDKLLQCVDADDKGVEQAVGALGRDIPLGEVAFVYLVGMPCSGRGKQKIDDDDVAILIRQVASWQHRSGKVGRRADCLDCVCPEEGWLWHGNGCGFRGACFDRLRRHLRLWGPIR